MLLNIRKWEEEEMFGRLGLVLAGALALLQPVGQADAATKIRISETGVQQHRLVVYVAKINGYFADEGLDVEFVTTRSGGDSMKLLASGAVDFAGTGPIDVYNARKQGLDIKIIAGVNQRLNNSILVQKSLADQIKSVKDMVGHTIGVATIGSGTWQAVVIAARHNGVDPDKLNFIATGPDLAEASFKSGRVDVLCFTDPLDISLVKDGYGSFLVDFTDDATHREYVGDKILFIDVAANADFLKAHPDETQAFMNALKKGFDWVHAHSPEEWTKLLQDNDFFTSVNTDLLTASLTRMAVAIPASPVVEADSYGTFYTLSDSLGILTSTAGLSLPMTYDAVVDNSFAEKAVAKQ